MKRLRYFSRSFISTVICQHKVTLSPTEANINGRLGQMSCEYIPIQTKSMLSDYRKPQWPLYVLAKTRLNEKSLLSIETAIK